MRSVVAGGAVMLLALVGLVACDDGGGPDPTPSTSDARPTTEEPTTEEPTTDAPTLTQEELDVEEALAAYEEFIAAYDAAAHEGFLPGTLTAAAIALTGGDYRASIIETMGTYQDAGLVQEGTRSIARVDALGYETRESETAVELRYCMDLTNVVVYRDEEPQGQNGRVVLDVQMVKQDASWMVWSMEHLAEEEC